MKRLLLMSVVMVVVGKSFAVEFNEHIDDAKAKAAARAAVAPEEAAKLAEQNLTAAFPELAGNAQYKAGIEALSAVSFDAQGGGKISGANLASLVADLVGNVKEANDPALQEANAQYSDINKLILALGRPRIGNLLGGNDSLATQKFILGATQALMNKAKSPKNADLYASAMKKANEVLDANPAVSIDTAIMEGIKVAAAESKKDINDIVKDLSDCVGETL